MGHLALVILLTWYICHLLELWPWVSDLHEGET
jgi:hypothetical protein